MKKEMIAMVMTGGLDTDFELLTNQAEKATVSFGGKYRLIDFTLSNCIHSGLDTVGIMTNPHPQRLGRHVGIGMPWDLDYMDGGVTILPCCRPGDSSVDGLRRNVEFIEPYDPEYVLLLQGDQVYKLDYSLMLRDHQKAGAEVTFVKDPMVVLFDWKVLKEALLEQAEPQSVETLLEHLEQQGKKLQQYGFKGSRKPVDTLDAYWQSNMDLLEADAGIDLYEEFWRIYTRIETPVSQYVATGGEVKQSIVGEGAQIYGSVYHSVIGSGVIVGEGSVIRDCVVMEKACIGEHCTLEQCLVGEGAVVENHTMLKAVEGLLIKGGEQS